jgi:hypothetical protein
VLRTAIYEYIQKTHNFAVGDEVVSPYLAYAEECWIEGFTVAPMPGQQGDSNWCSGIWARVGDIKGLMFTLPIEAITLVSEAITAPNIATITVPNINDAEIEEQLTRVTPAK